ncbi:purine-nucleoside phosphorylase [Candidatus Berkelbacteria bacterium]|nr:purine-nucleoside phosphorylase [Candidatus Berkelbacteria bacterium]
MAPKYCVVLGSGLTAVTEALIAGAEHLRLFYQNIQHFRPCTMSGHRGALVLSGDLAILEGRGHPYEERSAHELAHHVRTLGWLGCRSFILTNATGSLLPDLFPGSIALVEDHFCLPTGLDPTVGVLDKDNPDETRLMRSEFLDAQRLYHPKFLEQAEACAIELGIPAPRRVRYGIIQVGRRYETPAEIDFGRRVGIETVGMSLVTETLAIKAMGANTLAINGISNWAVGIEAALDGHPLTHKSVTDVMEELVAPQLSRLIPALVGRSTTPVPI